jgi:hypothetical protein
MFKIAITKQKKHKTFSHSVTADQVDQKNRSGFWLQFFWA